MLNRALTTELKNIILNKQLVDTGKMLNSSSVYLTNKKGVININIRTTEYFKYLYRDYKIIEALLESETFSEVITEESFIIIENILDETFTGNFNLIVSINNKPLDI